MLICAVQLLQKRKLYVLTIAHCNDAHEKLITNKQDSVRGDYLYKLQNGSESTVVEVN